MRLPDLSLPPSDARSRRRSRICVFIFALLLLGLLALHFSGEPLTLANLPEVLTFVPAFLSAVLWSYLETPISAPPVPARTDESPFRQAPAGPARTQPAPTTRQDLVNRTPSARVTMFGGVVLCLVHLLPSSWESELSRWVTVVSLWVMAVGLFWLAVSARRLEKTHATRRGKQTRAGGLDDPPGPKGRAGA